LNATGIIFIEKAYIPSSSLYLERKWPDRWSPNKRNDIPIFQESWGQRA